MIGIQKKLLLLSTAVFAIRIGLSFLPSFRVDMDAWMGWAMRLAAVGPANFYSDDTWTQYTPGFLYWLWFVGKIGWLSPLAIKIPVILADMLAGMIIWRIVSRISHSSAMWLYVLYVLNPVVIFDGSIWGQIDGILAAGMLASVYLLVDKRKSNLSWVIAGITLLVKPQAIATIPILGITTLMRCGWRRTMVAVSLCGLVVLMGFYPFFPDDTLLKTIELIHKMGVSYSYTSLFAFNWWALDGMWKPDNVEIWGRSLFFWGGLISSGFLSLILVRYWAAMRAGTKEIYLVAALACFTFFLFPTRVHERYLFPAFAFLYVYAGQKRQKSLNILLLIISLLYLGNLYYPYAYYEPTSNILNIPALRELIETLIIPIATSMVISYFVLVGWGRWGLETMLFPAGKKGKKAFPKKGWHGKTIEHGRDEE